MLSSSELARYSRHLALQEVGAAGQQKLKAARVLIIGAGGLGSPAALYLAASGVGTIGVLDCDRVDVSNLQRQVIYDVHSIGRHKAAAAKERLLALNPEIEPIAHQAELNAGNALEIIDAYDLVLDGTDRFTTRYVTNDACVILRKPLVSAAIHRFEGQAMTYVPGGGPCYRCLFPQPPSDGLVPNCAQAGVLGVLPGVMGTIQATEAIKLIVGVGEPLLGRLLTYDALAMRFDELRFERRVDCAVCGESPTITSPQEGQQACGTDLLARVRRLSPAELHDWLGGCRDGIAVIDVREPHEFAVCRLPAAVNIPLGQLALRLAEIPAAALPVFICRGGGRSLNAAMLALNAGAREVAHLEGGLLAWLRDVDSEFVVAELRQDATTRTA